MAKHVFPRPSVVKGVQCGKVTLGSLATVDVTINKVNMDTTLIVKTGGHSHCNNLLYLYNDTTVRCVNYDSATSYTYFYIIEFYETLSIPIGGLQGFPLKAEISGIKSVQQAYFYLGNSVDTLDVTINSVDLNKVLLLPCGTTDPPLIYEMVDSTHVRASRNYAPAVAKRGQCCVVEFY